MIRLIAAIALLMAAAGPAFAAPHLERVVVVLRHGIRPPARSNDVLAKYADRPWPSWPVAPGELTPHGGATVTLMGETVAAAYRKAGLLPRTGCAGDGEVSVWADNADERTRDSGSLFANAIQPSCGLEARWSQANGHDPIFSGTDQASCAVDADKLRAQMAMLADDPALATPPGPALERLQAILAPNACAGGAGTCFTAAPPPADHARAPVVFPGTSSLAEDLLLEYANDMPMDQVGWGRASKADIVAVMLLHERAFALIRDNTYIAIRRGAPMARIILAALAGQAAAGGPQSGPRTRLLVLSGHDSNLAWMAGVFGLTWRFADDPDFTAPSTTLAFELWSDGGREYVRPVIYYEALDQLRNLKPGRAETMALTFQGCADGPMTSCPLETLRRKVEAALPDDCGVL